jgi:hypothetical protein
VNIKVKNNRKVIMLQAVWLVQRHGDPCSYFEGIYSSFEAVESHYPDLKWERTSETMAEFKDYNNENFWTASSEIVQSAS